MRAWVAVSLAGWSAAVLAAAAAAGADHAAGGWAGELRNAAAAGLLVALVVPWSRLLERPRRGPPGPVRGVLALGALAPVVPALVFPLLPAAIVGAPAAAAATGFLGALALALPAALVARLGDPLSAPAALLGAGVAALAGPGLDSIAAACHAAATAALASSVLLLRASADLRATPLRALPGTGPSWRTSAWGLGLLVAILVLSSAGWSPLASPARVVATSAVLLLLAGSPRAPVSRGTALAAGLALAHALGLGRDLGVGPTAAAAGGATGCVIDGDRAEVRVLAQSGDASAVYDRATQEVALLDGGGRLDCHGPGRTHGALAGLAAAYLTAPGRKVVVHECVQAAELLRALGQLDVRETVGAPGLALLARRARVQGPVALPGAVEQELPLPEVAGLRRTLRGLPPASLGALVVSFPTPRAPYLADIGFHLEARTALGGGALLVPMPLDIVPPGLVRATCAAARAVHPQVQLVLVHGVLVLVATGQPVRWDTGPAFPGAAQAWCWAAGLSGMAELALARIPLRSVTGVQLPPDPLLLAARSRSQEPADGNRRMRENVDHLRAGLGPGASGLAVRLWLLDRPAHEDALVRESQAQLGAERLGSHLLLEELRRSRLGAAVDEVRAADPGDQDSMQRAAVVASAWCHVGAPHAVLQAALGLENANGSSVLDAAAAARRALAVDPTLSAHAPAALRAVLEPVAAAGAVPHGALEDLARLPESSSLAALCTGASPLAVALRARFGPWCAAALLEVRAARPWTLEELGALRELSSPAVLDAAAELLEGKAALQELLGVWRLDLPAPAGVARLVASGTEVRLALAEALARRKDLGSTRALAALLDDPDPGVRTAAGRTLGLNWPGTVPYDPSWERSQREVAARAVLALHNRRP